MCSIEAPETVLALLEVVAARWPEFRDLVLNKEGTDKGADVIIMVNGRHIEHLDGVATKLSDEDTVVLTPVVAGG